MSTLNLGCSLPTDSSIQKAKLNIVGWGWISPDMSGYVITEQVEEAKAAIHVGHRVIPVYETEQEQNNET